MNINDIESIKNYVQEISKNSNPIGKITNFLGDDIESRGMWKRILGDNIESRGIWNRDDVESRGIWSRKLFKYKFKINFKFNFIRYPKQRNRIQRKMEPYN